MRHRWLSVFSIFMRRILSGAVRTVVTLLIFGAALVATLRYMGVPVPSPHELFDFEAVSRLAKILS